MKPLGRKIIRNRIRDGERSFARQIIRGIFRIVIIFVCIGLTWYVTRLEIFTLHEVHVVGGETISHEDVRIRSMNELVGTYFLIIPKRFSYLYPHDRMIEVLEKIPRIHNVQIHRTERTMLEVTFDEYMPSALWCIYERDEYPCYFINNEGFAFTEAPKLQGGTLIRHNIEDIEEISPGQVMSTPKVEDINAFILRVEKELNFRVTTLTHKKNGDYEFHINGGGMILTASGKDFDATFENLKSVLSSSAFKHIAPGNFQYIDVRFDNKVFVNESLLVSTTTNASTTSGELSE